VAGVVAKPKTAALLVYLAVARPLGLHRRDTLLAMFWPETDESRARHSLNQAVYQLRRGLGRETVVSGRDEALGVDRSRVWADAVALDEAMTAGRLE
jgi:DNA-binding SARP family transcriptional activator